MKEKGQNLIEYALLLAIVVGIGFGLYGSSDSLAAHLQTIYSGAGNLLSQQSGQLEEQKRQQADYENATKMKTAMVDALRNKTLTMSDNPNAYVEAIVLRNPNSRNNRYDGSANNGNPDAKDPKVGIQINGKDYKTYENLWGMEGLKNVPRDIQQNSNDWYAVRVYQDGSAYYYAGTTEQKEQYTKNGGKDFVDSASATRRKM